jgi:APA family basic amino acid/polyamine antiporter
MDNMMGAGIFVTPGLVAAHLPGAAWSLGAWLAGGLLALAGAAVYGELGTRFPRAGGDYRYLHESFGPLPAFLTGWTAFLLTFSAAAAAMSITVAGYVEQAIPVPGGWPAWGAPLVGAILILALTWANVAGARLAGHLTLVLTAVPLVGLLVLFLAGLGTGSFEWHWPADPFRMPTEAWPVALGAGLIPIYFSYSGWNAAGYMAGEMRDPRRHLPAALLAGTGIVTAIYLAVNGVIVAVVPEQELMGSTTAAADAARRLLGPTAERGLAAIIALSIIGSANVTLMAGARVYYAMARDGVAPRFLGRVNRAGVPGAALWIAGIWTALLAAAGRFSALVAWSTLAMLLLSSLAVASLFVFRRRHPVEPGIFRCPGYPMTPVLYLVASLAVAAASAAVDPISALSGIALVLAGIPAYYLLRVRGTSA